MSFYAIYLNAPDSRKNKAESETDIAQMCSELILLVAGLLLSWILWHFCSKTEPIADT